MKHLDLICYELENILTLSNVRELMSKLNVFIEKYPHTLDDEDECDKTKQLYESVAGAGGEISYTIGRIFICTALANNKNNIESFCEDLASLDTRLEEIFNDLNAYMIIAFLLNQDKQDSYFSFLFKKELETEKIIKIIDSAIEVIKNKELYEYYTILYIKLIFLTSYLYNRTYKNHTTSFIKNFLQRKNKYNKIKMPNKIYCSFMANVFDLDKIIIKPTKNPKDKLQSYNIANNTMQDLENIKKIICSNT